MNSIKYEENEYRRYFAEIKRIEQAPILQRKEAQKDYMDALVSCPEIIAERIGWLFNGSYGWAEQQQALKVLNSPRMNRIAALSIMIAQKDHFCPARFAVNAYRKLSKKQQQRINELIQREIEGALLELNQQHEDQKALR